MKNFFKALSAQAQAAIYPLAFPGRKERNWEIIRIFKANNEGVHIDFYGSGGIFPFYYMVTKTNDGHLGMWLIDSKAAAWQLMNQLLDQGKIEKAEWPQEVDVNLCAADWRETWIRWSNDNESGVRRPQP